MITQTIPSYLYWQYQDEPVYVASQGYYAIPMEGIATEAITGLGPTDSSISDLQAFVNAYNTLTQEYLDSVNGLLLPIYTAQTGYLLDWVAQGIYGIARPTLPVAIQFLTTGVYNTLPYNESPYNQDYEGESGTYYPVTDDFFKRILTWNLYKGDGFEYTTPWLKRRVKRFLQGVNGINFPIEETYDVSVTYTAPITITITVAASYEAEILTAAIEAGVLYLPFQYSYVVNQV